MTPLVSILVPSYNASRFLPLLCKSIQAQTFSEFEVLIIDDGSRDGTTETVAPFLADSRFQLITLPNNRGLSAATFEGFRHMRGKFWCYPGADDVLKACFLERRLDCMARGDNAVMVFGPAELIDADGAPTAEVWTSPVPPRRISGDSLLRVLLQDNIINAPSVLVRSAVTERVISCCNGDWRFAFDWYLWILHAAVGDNALWDPEPMHFYRIHHDSLTWQAGLSYLRGAEIRMVPLCALSDGKGLSDAAAATWQRWGKVLYGLWLRRAAKLWLRGKLDPRWAAIATRSFRGDLSERKLWMELLRFAPVLIAASAREWCARRRLYYPVSGLAAMNDPLFQSPTAPQCSLE